MIRKAYIPPNTSTIRNTYKQTHIYAHIVTLASRKEKPAIGDEIAVEFIAFTFALRLGKHMNPRIRQNQLGLNDKAD